MTKKDLHPNNVWQFEGKPFTREDADKKIAEGFIGFIYIVTDNSNGKKYLGKKVMARKVKLAPLKGQTRKRSKIAHSDWEKYFGSNVKIQMMVEERVQDFSREILLFCKKKGELNYREAQMQFELEVLLRDDFYNGIIDVKINENHVRSLWKNGTKDTRLNKK